MKVFVSGKIGDESKALEAMSRLGKAGHSLTFDWTTIPHLKPYESNSAASSEAAMKEVEGVLEADALVVIPHEHGVGMFVEVGVAIGAGIPVYVVSEEPSRTMFFYHPLVTIVETLDDLMHVLDNSLPRKHARS